MKKKLILAIAAVACLAAVVACGSMAYFTASKQVTNKFYVSSFDPDNPGPLPPTNDELFSIKVEETEVKDGIDQATKTTTGNTYKDATPGSSYTKDPVVTSLGKYDAYVRVNVTFTRASQWATCYTKAALSTNTDLTPILKNLDTTNWTQDKTATKVDASNNTITYVFYYGKVLKQNDATTPIFTKVVIPAQFEQADMVALNGTEGFKISVTADAIQAANTGANAQAAFTSYWK